MVAKRILFFIKGGKILNDPCLCHAGSPNLMFCLSPVVRWRILFEVESAISLDGIGSLKRAVRRELSRLDRE